MEQQAITKREPPSMFSSSKLFNSINFVSIFYLLLKYNISAPVAKPAK
jgi:hypothetical protein